MMNSSFGGPQILCAAVAAVLTAAPAAAATPEQILTNSAVWGKDFPALLAQLPSWDAAREKTVIVFPERAVGGTPYTRQDAARSAATRFSTSLAARPPTPKQAFQALMQEARPAARRFRVEVSSFREDRSYRLAWSAAPAQLLAESLTIKQVHEALGPPEKVATELIQGEGERRPTVLTLHAYAGGALVFAESDLAPKPGVVDRAILTIARVKTVVFKEGR